MQPGFDGFSRLRPGLVVDGVQAGGLGACDIFQNVVDENGRFPPHAQFNQSLLINGRLRFHQPDFIAQNDAVKLAEFVSSTMLPQPARVCRSTLASMERRFWKELFISNTLLICSCPLANICLKLSRLEPIWFCRRSFICVVSKI